MNKKGFTLVELLTVIVLLGLITIIGVQFVQKISLRIKINQFEAKEMSAQNALITWSQENEKCFMDTTGIDCIISIVKDCESNGDNLTCHTTYGNLASHDLIGYDKDNIVINPVDNSDMSDDLLYITYNKYKRIFSALPRNIDHPTKEPITYTISPRPGTTETIYDENNKPMISLQKNNDTTWRHEQSDNVIIQDIDSGLAKGGYFMYGWSDSPTVEPNEYTKYTLNYPNGTTEKIIAEVSTGMTLSGKMYLWLKPNIKDRLGNAADNLTSIGSYYVDNTPPEEVQMNFVYGDWATYEGNWTKRNIYVARSKESYNPSGGNDLHSGLKEYQISLDNQTWEEYNYNNKISLYKLGEGIHERYFRACDKVGNCNSPIVVTAYVDQTPPVISDLKEYSGYITFKISDKEEGSGVDSYCLTDGSSSSSCSWTKYTGINIYNTPLIRLDNNNTVTIHLFAKDKAGNISAEETIIPSGVTVIFHRNISSTDTTTKTKFYALGVANQKFETFGWTKSGKTLYGWNLEVNKDKVQRDYTATSGVNDTWINDRLGQAVHLYAKWVSIKPRQVTCYTLSAASCSSLVEGCTCRCGTTCWCADEANGGWQGEVLTKGHWWAYKNTDYDKCPAAVGNTNYADWYVDKGCPNGYKEINNTTNCIKWD